MLKSDKNNKYFTRRPTYIYSVNLYNEQSVLCKLRVEAENTVDDLKITSGIQRVLYEVQAEAEDTVNHLNIIIDR